MTTAAAYIRKSNDQQDRTEDVKSVATQRDLVAAFAAAHGWTLDEQHVFADDGITGALFAERPGLQALLAETRTAPVPFSKLIVVEQSRLGRDQIDTMVLIRDIEEAGIEIWSTRDGRRITLSDDTSKLLASLEAWRDESERKKTATRVRDAAKTRFERGYVVGGRVYGYRNERLPGVKGAARLAIIAEQAEIVRRIFRMAADGLGLSRVARQLNAEAVAGPQRLSDADVEKLRLEGEPVPVNQWSVSGVREVLYRELYRGVVTFGKVRRTGPKSRVKLPRQQWQTRSDESLRIVEQDPWDAAHARLAAAREAFLRATDRPRRVRARPPGPAGAGRTPAPCVGRLGGRPRGRRADGPGDPEEGLGQPHPGPAGRPRRLDLCRNFAVRRRPARRPPARGQRQAGLRPTVRRLLPTHAALISRARPGCVPDRPPGIIVRALHGTRAVDRWGQRRRDLGSYRWRQLEAPHLTRTAPGRSRRPSYDSPDRSGGGGRRSRRSAASGSDGRDRAAPGRSRRSRRSPRPSAASH